MTIKTTGTQKEAKVLEFINKEPLLLHYDIEYDTTKPEEAIREFSDNIRKMISRYEGNKVRIFEIENELNDIEHYMEIGNFKNVHEGYRLYRKLAELRRERRACKNENDLLWPIYEYFHATEVLNRLGKVQGDCAGLKETIDGRYYTVRTDILGEWIKPEEKEEPAGITTETFLGKDLKEHEVFEKEEKLNADQARKTYELVWKETMA